MTNSQGESMFSKKILAVALGILFSVMHTPALINEASAQDERMIELPAPDKKGGMPLMQALAERQVSRVYPNAALTKQEMADLLWATYGINRDNGKRTVPTAHNKQNMTLYVYVNKAFWIYDAENNALHKILEKDMDDKLKGSLTLIYAAEDAPYTDMSVGSMYQNAALYAASAGLQNLVKVNGAQMVHETIAAFLPSKYRVRVLQSISKK